MTLTRQRRRDPKVPFVGGGSSPLHTSGVLIVALLCASVWVMHYSTPNNAYLYVTFLVAAIGAVGLNLLMGTAGQVSIGNAAFLAVGAFTAVFMDRSGVPFGVGVVVASLVAGAAGLVVGIPALRIRGIYLALATFAAHFIVLFGVQLYQAKTVGDAGFYLPAQFGARGTGVGYWPVVLVVALTLAIIVATSVSGGECGRVMRLVRDHETAAAALGVGVARAKLLVFTISSAIVGFAGGLSAYLNGTVSSASFTLSLAISYLAMILIGGTDSIVGSVVGAAIISWMPTLSSDLTRPIFGSDKAAAYAPQVSQILYGLLIVTCILVAPSGIVGKVQEAFDRLNRLRRLRRTTVVSSAGIAENAS